MRIKLTIDVGDVYAKGTELEVYEQYRDEWDREKGEIDIQLQDGSVYQLFAGEYTIV